MLGDDDHDLVNFCVGHSVAPFFDGHKKSAEITKLDSSSGFFGVMQK